MIQVTTVVYKEYGPEQSPEVPFSWRVRSCTIDFEGARDRITLWSDFVYASPQYAYDDMKQQALEKMRFDGYTGPESDILWRLYMIG
jgi:hypothetical protein